MNMNSMSLQVLKPNGSPFTYTKYGREYEIRLWVYWENTNWYLPKKLKDEE